MSFPVTCPECGDRQAVPDEVAGKRLRCKSCKAVFRAGTAEVEVVEDDPPPRRRPRPQDDDDEDDRPTRKSKRVDRDDPPPKKRGTKPRSKLPLVLGLVGLVVLLGGGLAAYLMFGRSTPTDFTDPDGVFTARFPAKPKHDVVVEPGRGVLAGERVDRAKVDGIEYAVTVFWPFAPNGAPTQWRDKQLKEWATTTAINTRSESISEEPVNHEGHTGIDVILRYQSQGRAMFVRLLASEKYVLRMTVAGDASDGGPAKNLREKALAFFATVHVGPSFGSPIN